MTQITNLTNYADQLITLTLPDGGTATLELVYSAGCQRWWANVTYLGTTINGIGVCTFPNILRQWMDIFQFGLAVATADGTDPFNINDFVSTTQYPQARATITFLNAQDVANVEANTFGSAVQV
jgi:hypothetical protein